MLGRSSHPHDAGGAAGMWSPVGLNHPCTWLAVEATFCSLSTWSGLLISWQLCSERGQHKNEHSKKQHIGAANPLKGWAQMDSGSLPWCSMNHITTGLAQIQGNGGTDSSSVRKMTNNLSKVQSSSSTLSVSASFAM